MKPTKYFIIDFDSTFTQVEALDVLAEISLKNNENQAKAVSEIKSITDLGMEGGMSFRESLHKRLEILEAEKKHLISINNTMKDEPLGGKIFNIHHSII